MQHYIDSYGKVVIKSYTRITVTVSGSGKEVILLLGRKTSPSSTIELKPLIHFLKDQYTLVTINYLGSDSSDNYHSDRTLENITGEIHEVMELLGHTSYAIVAIAYAGLYSLYYADKYKNEVRAVIGIDSFVAEQRYNETYMENVRFIHDLWSEFHTYRFVQWIVEKMAALYLKKARAHYRFSEIDVENYSSYASYMLENMTLLDRYKSTEENFETLDNISYPSGVPILFLLSGHRSRKIKGWYDMHKRLINNSNSEIITLRGEKNLHLKQADKLASEIKSFLERLRDKM